MSTIKKLMMTAASGAEALAIEDVFSTYLYTGTGTTNTITNGIDLAGEGGMVWFKWRSEYFTSRDHFLFDTERGPTSNLKSNLTNAEQDLGANSPLASFNSDGFTLSDKNTGLINANFGPASTYASWTFRKAPRFFDVVTYTGSGTGLGQVINHNLGVTPGFVVIKRTDSTSNWLTAHRSLNGQGVALNLSDGQDGSYYAVYGNNDSITDATVKVSVGADFSGATYVMYLFAHDPLGESGDGSDGLIACGSGTIDSHVELGWEPQFVLAKATTSAYDWQIFDNMRGMTPAGLVDPDLKPNSSAAEAGQDNFILSSTGFTYTYGPAQPFIYIAIRRGPMRQPTSGTEVFQPLVRSGTGTNTNINFGFPIDSLWSGTRTNSITNTVNGFRGIFSRMQGRYVFLDTTSAGAEQSYSNSLTGFDVMNGASVGTDGSIAVINYSGSTYVNYGFRRAPGFFDVVAYGATGETYPTVSHNLGASPELVIIKERSGVADWWVAHNYDLTKNFRLNGTNAAGAYQIVSSPTESSIAINFLGINAHNDTKIIYLFATLPGVSKVGSYTGNGSSQTIDCGFTSGARFVLIKRTDSTGDWYVWDTARGIVAANDPYLRMNVAIVEVTSNDSVDPDSSGFIVNQVAATNINVNAASYIYLAIA